ncbi:hypothetical protein SAMN04488005_1399 [Yoonia tamlensis]|uniref:Uncharacterized protein n=1 Tax=Yoonia tamlensis TaxID=390270 RepID=A0A1I6GBY3_9RHOB|nr:hypothetical protein [Yoonia tamlensis]SFR39692.1 hypothetical protein SAMN04488005_1399 [Yoonia tamlensis]
MTDAPLSFDILRASAIAAAQDASGKVWTDFNLHDPGVTLLEQTVFALSEIAYQGDHSVRDLLTDKTGLDLQARAVFAPQDVLPGRPVTHADLAGRLSQLDGIARVFVTRGPAAGLVDLLLIPQKQNADATLIAQTRACFEDNRILATAINRIDIATPQPVVITGEIAISPLAQPDRIVAEIIYQLQLLFKGMPVTKAGKDAATGATRVDLFADPAGLWPQLPADARNTTRLEQALAGFRDIAGVVQVGDFGLFDPITQRPIADIPHDPRSYFAPVLPQIGQPVTITVTRDGGPVVLNPHTIQEELGRITAAAIAQQGNHRDKSDWDTGFAGKQRRITGPNVNSTLPTAYRIASDQPKNAGLSDYRTMIDHHLQAMRAGLGDIPAQYAQDGDCDLRDPAAVRARVEMLDYLIALQGEEMPLCDPASLHAYRSVAERLQWDVVWRAQYLARLPAFNYFSGTMHPQFGLAARLAHLADLAVASHQGVDAITVDPQMEPPAPPIKAADVILPVRPMDAFVQRDDTVAPLTLAKLAMSCPWVVDARTTPALFARAAQVDAYIVARNRKSDWEVMFQPVAGGDLYPCGSSHNRQTTVEWANRLRNSFVEMHRNAEKFWLFEDIALRQKQTDFAPAQATIMLPGWTARTSRPSFRLFVADLVTRLAPAHVFVRLLWLTPQETRTLRPMLADWYRDPQQHAANIRQAIQTFSHAARDP